MIYTELLEKQILDRLQIDNPWWKAGHIPDFFAKMTPRLYLDIFMSLVEATDLSRAVILMGPRRVGKIRVYPFERSLRHYAPRLHRLAQQANFSL